jgi:hypothetical protein
MSFDTNIRSTPPADLHDRWKTQDTILRGEAFTEYTRETTWWKCAANVLIVGLKALGTIAFCWAIIPVRLAAGSSDTANRLAQLHDKNGIKATIADGINNEQVLVPKSAKEKTVIATKRANAARFKEDEIKKDLDAKRFFKSPDGKYLIRIVPEASSFIFMPVDENGQPKIGEARQVELFNANDHTSFADKDTILLHAVDYLKYWDHLGEKGMATDALFVMNLSDGTAHGYKKMPKHDIELDNVAEAHTNYGTILSSDVQKAIKEAHATEQGQKKKREIPKLDAYEPAFDPFKGLGKGGRRPSIPGPTIAELPAPGTQNKGGVKIEPVDAGDSKANV